MQEPVRMAHPSGKGTGPARVAEAVRDHYDRISGLYRTFWGEHIHHGFWQTGEESREEAQEKLMVELAAQAGIPRGAHVLDAGCGLGGSSRWLARQLECTVVGITISPVQAHLARKAACLAGLSDRIRFEVADVCSLELASGSFDVIWVIECSEHLEEKRTFLRHCHDLLRPGGVLAICAWVAPDDLPSLEQQRLLRDICDGMICPDLASRREYSGWMGEAGFHQIVTRDVTPQVKRTWELCGRIIARPEIQTFLRHSDRQTRRFAGVFPAMLAAYETGAMGYAICTARKPG